MPQHQAVTANPVMLLLAWLNWSDGGRTTTAECQGRSVNQSAPLLDSGRFDGSFEGKNQDNLSGVVQWDRLRGPAASPRRCRAWPRWSTWMRRTWAPPRRCSQPATAVRPASDFQQRDSASDTLCGHIKNAGSHRAVRTRKVHCQTNCDEHICKFSSDATLGRTRVKELGPSF